MLYRLLIDTWYICIPIIFALAVLDPLLTVLSYRHYKKTLARDVNMEQFELNPRWQKAVSMGKFLPVSYLVRVGMSVGVLLLFFIMPEILGPERNPRAALVGYLFCTYLVIDLNHIGNLRSFGLKRHMPEQSGETPRVKLGYSYSLGLTKVSYETTFILLFILWLIMGGYFLFGAAMAPLVIAYRLYFMRKAALRKEDGLPPRNYRKLRMAILLALIAAVLVFVHFHRIEGYYLQHVRKGDAYFMQQKYLNAAGEYRLALKYIPDGSEALESLVEAIESSPESDDKELELLKLAWIRHRNEKSFQSNALWHLFRSIFERND